jgi:hypothetical protein
VPIEEPEEGDERTTEYVMSTLYDDLDKCFKRLEKDFDNPDEEGLRSYDESDARDYVRTAFACIEATSFSVRMWAAAKLLDQDKMSEEERWMVSERNFDLRNGKVVERVAKIPLEENIKFMFALLDRVHGTVPRLDTGKEWWSNFKKAIKIRDRLTHPKLPHDLDMSGDDVMTIVSAEAGFRELLSSYASPDPAGRHAQL